MCGIAGFIDYSASAGREDLRALVTRMSCALKHRGPDSSGEWVDEQSGVALGFRRLAIIDLSEAGSQPMKSASGRYVLMFNGEIYNFQELRAELDLLPPESRPSYRGHSDTEVMLAAFEQWGIVESVRRFNGMFAFAVWDARERQLHLARDRMGEKPLYYADTGKLLLFASELKGLRAYPGFQPEINRDAVAQLLLHSYIAAPHSVYTGVHKLEPATILTVSVRESESRLRFSTYWSAMEVAQRGCAQPLNGDPEEAVDQVEALLSDSVKIRMIADVPLGAFLSGGIDSSTLLALMQTHSRLPVKTYTIGFQDDSYNEANFAKAVAQHLKSEHTELYVTDRQAMEVIPRLPVLYDEPFADSSQIPTFLVSQLARRHVTVSLSGDGGDEVFGGYSRYLWVDKIHRTVGRLPQSARKAIAWAMTAPPTQLWNSGFSTFRRLWSNGAGIQNPAEKIQKIADVVSAGDAMAMYFRLVCTGRDTGSTVLGATHPLSLLQNMSGLEHLGDSRAQMMYLDSVTYLPDDILVKVDRASMGVSLESRAPYLDHRLVELSWRLPVEWKLKNGQGKWFLRQILSKYVPTSLFERRKAGFAIPLGAWLRGPLREWAEALLDEARLRREGYLDPAATRRKWTEHLAGTHDWFSAIWNVLAFQGWLEEARKTAA